MKRLRRFSLLASSFVLINICLFEMFGDSTVSLHKEHQLIRLVRGTDLPHIVSAMAEYVHKKAPFLEEIPYATRDTDIRLSTWYLPPHQVVIEWVLFSAIFIWIISHGKPSFSGDTTGNRPPGNPSLFLISSATLLAVIFYKLRAWIELGEWFAPLYLLQPCHVLLTGYVVVCYLKDAPRFRPLSRTIFHVLFDLQWFTYVATALPDTRALLERDFFGEYFLFYFEHILLMVLPVWLKLTRFDSCSHTTSRERLYRALYSTAWFGIHHIQVMTPVSLVSGIQINYQTHLPEYALPWFGKMYKPVITGLSFVAIMMFAFIVDPLMVRTARKKTTKTQ